MAKYLAIVLAVAALTAMPLQPGKAEEKPEKQEKAEKKEKKTGAQQQKMKDCAAKWKEEKATKNVKGREAYRTFMSGCLKG